MAASLQSHHTKAFNLDKGARQRHPDVSVAILAQIMTPNISHACYVRHLCTIISSPSFRCGRSSRRIPIWKETAFALQWPRSIQNARFSALPWCELLPNKYLFISCASVFSSTFLAHFLIYEKKCPIVLVMSVRPSVRPSVRLFVTSRFRRFWENALSVTHDSEYWVIFLNFTADEQQNEKIRTWNSYK
jgi:hypothetical protein